MESVDGILTSNEDEEMFCSFLGVLRGVSEWLGIFFVRLGPGECCGYKRIRSVIVLYLIRSSFFLFTELHQI
jgi:hypothetical protein